MPITRISDNIFIVPSSDGSGDYKVTLDGHSVSCECKGFKFNRTCRHIDEVRKIVPEPLRINTKKLDKYDDFPYVQQFSKFFEVLKK